MSAHPQDLGALPRIGAPVETSELDEHVRGQLDKFEGLFVRRHSPQGW